MAHLEERPIGDLVLRIDRHLCVGFGDCIDAAAEAFELDDDGIAVFREGAATTPREHLLEACRSCPVDALTAHDASGRQVAP